MRFKPVECTAASGGRSGADMAVAQSGVQEVCGYVYSCASSGTVNGSDWARGMCRVGDIYGKAREVSGRT